MNKNDFFLDKYWQADPARVPKMIAGLFTSDIQGSESYCQEILAAVRAANSTADYRWQTAGNAYVVTVLPAGTEITCQFTNDPAYRISPEDMAEILEMWIDLFQKIRRR